MSALLRSRNPCAAEVKVLKVPEGSEVAATTPGFGLTRRPGTANLLSASRLGVGLLALILRDSSLASAATEAACTCKSGCDASGLEANGGVAQVGSPICTHASQLGSRVGLSQFWLVAVFRLEAGSGGLLGLHKLAL